MSGAASDDQHRVSQRVRMGGGDKTGDNPAGGRSLRSKRPKTRCLSRYFYPCTDNFFRRLEQTGILSEIGIINIDVVEVLSWNTLRRATAKTSSFPR